MRGALADTPVTATSTLRGPVGTLACSEQEERLTAKAAAGSEDRTLRAPAPAEIRAGLPASFLDRLKGALEVTEAQLASVVGIPRQTLVRRRSEGVLRRDEGDRAATVARVLERALSYFDGDERMRSNGSSTRIRRWPETRR